VAAVLLWRAERDSRVRWAAGLVAAGCSLSIVLTLTRSIWIGSAIALALALMSSSATRRLFLPIAGAVTVMALLALALVPGLSQDASTRESDQQPIWDRENTNGAAIRMIEERPLFGFGWFEFQSQNANHQRLADDHIITGADLEEHNVFLSNAAELGLLGTVLWAAALLTAIGAGIFRRGPPELGAWQVGLVAIAVQWLIVANFVPLGYAFPTALLWLWAGITWWRPAPVLAPGPAATIASEAPTREGPHSPWGATPQPQQ
jgi:O-antigen ligase